MRWAMGSRIGRTTQKNLKKIARTWKYIFRTKSIPPTLSQQIEDLVSGNLREAFSSIIAENESKSSHINTYDKQEQPSDELIVCGAQTVESHCPVPPHAEQQKKKNKKHRRSRFGRRLSVCVLPTRTFFEDVLQYWHGVTGNMSHPRGATCTCDFDND